MILDSKIISDIERSPLPEALALISGLFPGQVVFSSSLGQEDQVLTDVIFRNNINIGIFTIDTGRLFNETYELMEKVSARYRREVRVYFPDAQEVEAFVSNKGINSFYESIENRKACCAIRKIGPLNRALEGARVWITGLRGDQSGNRSQMPMIEWMEDKQLYKFNPLIHWTLDEVLAYINQHNVPYNVLHDKSFVSIGCAPCTRAIEPGENVRAGRWWWEESQKECGLHGSMRR